jgi:hypothetical protein
MPAQCGRKEKAVDDKTPWKKETAIFETHGLDYFIVHDKTIEAISSLIDEFVPMGAEAVRVTVTVEYRKAPEDD